MLQKRSALARTNGSNRTANVAARARRSWFPYGFARFVRLAFVRQPEPFLPSDAQSGDHGLPFHAPPPLPRMRPDLLRAVHTEVAACSAAGRRAAEVLSVLLQAGARYGGAACSWGEAGKASTSSASQ